MISNRWCWTTQVEVCRTQLCLEAQQQQQSKTKRPQSYVPIERRTTESGKGT